MRMDKRKLIQKRPDGSVRVATVNDEPSKTDQQWKEMVDVNNIVAKYKKTGEWRHLTRKGGVYADVSEIPDYYEALQRVGRAQEAFMSLPSHLRLKFDNDPGKLLAFLQDPSNKDEAIKIGLVDAPVMVDGQKNETKNEKKPSTKTDPQLEMKSE